MNWPGKFLVKPFAGLALAVCFASAGAELRAGEPAARYEYKLVRLGSLSSLQKEETAEAKRLEVEETLNEAGLEGWEMVSVFAVRTTFDPNVFFAIMKRPMADLKKEGEAP
jgi:hypothetical protein